MNGLILTIFIISAAKYISGLIPRKSYKNIFWSGINFSSTNAAILVLTSWYLSTPLGIVMLCVSSVIFILLSILNID